MTFLGRLVAVCFLSAACTAQENSKFEVSLFAANKTKGGVQDIEGSELKLTSPIAIESSLTWVGEEPLNFYLLIDTSSSVGRGSERLQRVSAFLAKQVPAFLRDGRDDIRLVVFDSSVVSIDVSGTDAETEARIIQAIDSRGGTAVYDAVFYTSQEMAKRTAGRRIILIATDGVDNQSRVNREEAYQEAIRNGVVVFAFAMGSVGDGLAVLESITSNTGGRSWTIDSPRDLDTAWREMRQLLAAQYTLRFTASKPVEKRESVKIAVTRPDLTLYFPRAVFAPKAPKKKK